MYIIIGVCGIFTMPLLGKVADRLVKSKGNEPEARDDLFYYGPVGAIGCILLDDEGGSIMAGRNLLCSICCYWAVEPDGCAIMLAQFLEINISAKFGDLQR